MDLPEKICFCYYPSPKGKLPWIQAWFTRNNFAHCEKEACMGFLSVFCLASSKGVWMITAFSLNTWCCCWAYFACRHGTGPIKTRPLRRPPSRCVWLAARSLSLHWAVKLTRNCAVSLFLRSMLHLDILFLLARYMKKDDKIKMSHKWTWARKFRCNL